MYAASPLHRNAFHRIGIPDLFPVIWPRASTQTRKVEDTMTDSLQARSEELLQAVRRLGIVILIAAGVALAWTLYTGWGRKSLLLSGCMIVLGAVTTVCVRAMICADSLNRSAWVWAHMGGTFLVLIVGLFLSKAWGVSAIVVGLVLICEHFLVFIYLGVTFSRIMREYSRTESTSYNEEND